MAELRYDGRVAIVTGAGRGLGREYARLLAARGAKVVVNDLGGNVDLTGSSEAPANEVVREIREAGGEAVANAHSVETREGGEAIVQAALDAFGRVDIIVSNAGGGSPDLAKVLAVHLQGAFWVIRPAWKAMKEQGYGRIVTITSGAGLWGFHGRGMVEAYAYGAAKMGLVGLMRSLAMEGRAHNVHANALAPVAWTRMTEGMPAKYTRWLSEHCPPGHVAPAVAWLVHEDCPATGEIFTAGGGRVARVILAEADGFWRHDLQPEDVRDNFARVCDETGYHILKNADEELDLYGSMMGVPLE